MENLKAKLKKQGGFTMVEMLIVVAIIAILIAVSIPMFNSALEKAHHGVDMANARDAISLAYAEYLGDANPKETFKDGKDYQYVVTDSDHKGKLTTGTTGGVTPQCTCENSPTTATLGVKITYNSGTPGEPKIELTGWEFDTTKNKTVEVTTTP